MLWMQKKSQFLFFSKVLSEYYSLAPAVSKRAWHLNEKKFSVGLMK